MGGHRLIAKDYADGAMPVNTDDDVPESALSRMRRRWMNVRTAIRSRSLNPAFRSEPRQDFQPNGSQETGEKDLEASSSIMLSFT